jgi:outer membrane autotransporter protein
MILTRKKIALRLPEFLKWRRLTIFFLLSFFAHSAFADSWLGSTSNDWFNAANWNAGVPNATLDVNINGGTFSPTISIPGAAANTLFVGNGSGNSGTIFVNGGGSFNNGTSHLGFDSSSTGTALIDGTGSNWTTGGILYVGEGGSGSLLISGGATVNSANSYVGFSGSGSGFASVDGAGTTWNNNGTLILSNSSSNTGTMSITNGGLLSDTDAIISLGGTGDVTVSNVGSLWQNSNSLVIGNGGVANLTIFDSGQVTVAGTQTVYIGANSNLNIGGKDANPSAAAGTLNAVSVQLNSGSSAVVFNHTTTNYTFAPSISGSGFVLQEGSGTTVLTGTNAYTGGTNVSAGTLQGTTNGLQGSITNNSHVVFDQTSAGNFNGSISGTGDVTKNNIGAVVFNNANSYTGNTLINAGTLQVAADSNLGATSSTVIFGFDPANPNTNGTLAVANNAVIPRTIILNNSGTFETIGQNTQLSLSHVSGTGNLFKTGAGVLVFTSAEGYTGNTIVQQGTLKGGLKNAFAITPLIQIDNGGTFDLGGVQQTVHNVINNGTISISAFVPGSTIYNQLDISGNLSGTGTIAVSTDLVKVVGDLITIAGTSAGTQVLSINNDEQGIDPAPNTVLKVVQTTDGKAIFSGSTDAGTFRYDVLRGDGSTLAPDFNSFYLELSPTQDLTGTANAAIGIFSTGLFLYYADMQTLIQRMGELHLNDASGLWIKPYGNRMQIYNQVSHEYKLNAGGIDIGIDRGFNPAFGGHLNTGIFGGYLYSSQNFYIGGNGVVQEFSAGAYATWLQAKGWYVDFVAKYSQLWNNFVVALPTQTSSTANYSIPSIGASVEIGKRFDRVKKSYHYFLEPELQLETVYLDGKKYVASNGLNINADKQTSFQGRIGARTGLHFDFAHKKSIEPYIHASLIQEFVGKNRITTNATPFNTIYPPTVGRLGGGFAAQIAQSAFAYAEYDYAFGQGFHEPVAISLGVRIVC